MLELDLDAFDPPPEFIQEVRNVLDHLYDHVYLLTHPLTDALVDDPRLDQISRAQHVRRTLLHCIEALQPQTKAGADATRAYSVLMYRCVDGLAMSAIAAKLTLSERQAYREYTKGIEAIARILWKMIQRQPKRKAANDEATDREIPKREAQPAPQPPDALTDRLTLARAEAERLHAEISVELVIPTELLQVVYAMLTPRIHKTGTQILISAPTPCPPIWADRTMLRQALLTILSHALDVVAERSQITVSISGEEELQFKISGPLGKRSQEPSAQPHEAVGVAVAQMLLRGQGGDLRIEIDDQEWQSLLLLPTAQTVTILVVDDNENIRALFQRYLAGHKVSTIGATNGQQALELATTLHPQLIFLDLMLPHHDGWEILQELKQNPVTRAIPIVICSVLNERELALAMGARDYLTKPVSQTAFLDVLRRWLGRLNPRG